MKKLRACLAVISALVVLLGNCSFAAVFNPSAKNTYLLLEKKNIESISKSIKNNDFVKLLNSKKLKTDFEIYTENIPGDWGNLKLTSTEETDVKNKYQYGKLTLGTKEKEAVSLEIVLNNSKLMVKVPEIYENSISIDISKLEDIFEKFDIEISEDEINAFKTQILSGENQSVLTAEETAYINKIMLKYKLKLNKLLDAKYFSTDKNANIEYGGKEIACKSAKFEISAYDIITILEELWQDIKSDDKLMDIIIHVWTVTGNVSGLTREEIIENVDSVLSEINSEDTKEDLEKGKITSTLYYNSKNEILKREVRLTDIVGEETEWFSLTTINNSKDAFFEVKMEELTIQDAVTKGNKRTDHNVSLITESYKYDYETYERIPYTETQTYQITVENPKKNEYIATLSIDSTDEKYIVKAKNTVSGKIFASKLEFIMDTADADYKVFVNYSIENASKIIKRSLSGAEFNLNKKSKEEIQTEYENALPSVKEKAEKLFEELFPKTMKTMKMMENTKELEARVDKATAAQIGKAVRIWETDAVSDRYLNINDRISSDWREYSSLEDIEMYVSPDVLPGYLEGAKYYVCKNSDERIIVGISNNSGLDLPMANSVLQVDYDGSKSGVSYIEP